MEKTIDIEISGKEWQEALEEAFQHENKKAKIDGFRAGKAPKDIFLKKYGVESLFNEAVNVALEVAYKKMVKENKDLDLVAEPKVSIKSITEKEVVLSFALVTRPEVKLGKYKNLGVKQDKVEVTKKEIDEEIEHLKSHYAEIITKEGKIENNDTAVIDFEGFLNGVAFSGGKGSNYSLKIGSNSFIPGFEEQLIGMVKDEEKEITVTFPSDYHDEKLKGQKTTFKIKINEVKATVIPEIGKAFFEDLGMEGIDTIEALEKQVKENIKLKKESDAENKYIDEVLAKAGENTKVEIPDVMIEDELARMLEQYKQNLSMQGLTIEQFYQFTKSNEEDLKQKLKPEANNRVKYRLMLEEIAKKEKVEIPDAVAKEEAKKLADKYQMAESEFLKSFGGLDMIKYDLKMRKAIEILKENKKD